MGQDEASKDEIDAMLRKLEKNMDQLRRAYEKFFVGSRDRPPQNQRSQVTRQIRELEGTRISNTSQRFRFRSLQQRFVSLKQKWNRVQREIEQGTYAPHKQKAKKRMEDRQRQEDQEADQNRRVDESDDSTGEGQEEFVEIDPEMSRVDLKSLERELEEMDQEGEFEKYVATDRVKRPSEEELENQRKKGEQGGDADPSKDSPAASGRQESHRPGEDNVFSGQETTRKEKLRSLQDKLGISKGGDDSSSSSGGRSKSFEDASREPTKRLSEEDLDNRQKNRPDQEAQRRRRERSRRTSRSRTSSSENQGDDGSESKSRGRSNRVIRRSSDDDSTESSSDDDDDGRDRRLYNRLVDAKRDAGESVDDMNFDEVRDSIQARRDALREEHGRDVSFNIVRKGDSVYLQPNLDEDDE